MTVKIVTDSTSDMPVDIAKKLGITVVPLTVSFGHESFLDQVEMDTDEFYRRLSQENIFPTTTQPAPGIFADLYNNLVQETDEILVIVISSKLSGTYQSATNAINMVQKDCRIEVIDSMGVAMNFGLLVAKAAEMANGGASLAEISKAVRSSIPRSHLIAFFDTLKYLAKGGRVGKAQSLLGLHAVYKTHPDNKRGRDGAP